jgi:hypothetical protein
MFAGFLYFWTCRIMRLSPIKRSVIRCVIFDTLIDSPNPSYLIESQHIQSLYILTLGWLHG